MLLLLGTQSAAMADDSCGSSYISNLSQSCSDGYSSGGGSNYGYSGGSYSSADYSNYVGAGRQIGSSIANLIRGFRNSRRSNTNNTVTNTGASTVTTTSTPSSGLTDMQRYIAERGLMPVYEHWHFPGYSYFLDPQGNLWTFSERGVYLGYTPQYRQLKWGT